MSDFKFGPIQEKWLESLEKNAYRQQSLRLGTKNSDLKKEQLGDLDPNDYRACCLGELGLVAGICKWMGSNLVSKTSSPHTEHAGLLMGVYEEVGLYSAAGERRRDGHTIGSLSIMNDNGNYTWPQIAAEVRAHPEEFFCKPV